MTYYDAAMVIAVALGMAWGAWRGITWQLASIASLVLGYSVAYPLSDQLRSHFPGDPAMARALAMMAVYAAVAGGVFLAAWIVRATLRRMKFEAFDRHLGMVLGGLEGALLGMIVTLFVVSLAPSTREPIFSSTAGRAVGRAMEAVGPILPGEFRETVAASLRGDRPEAANPSAWEGPKVEWTPKLEWPPRVTVDGKPRTVEPARDPEVFKSRLLDAGTRIGRALADEAEESIDRMGRDAERSIDRMGRTDERNPRRR